MVGIVSQEGNNLTTNPDDSRQFRILAMQLSSKRVMYYIPKVGTIEGGNNLRTKNCISYRGTKDMCQNQD